MHAMRHSGDRCSLHSICASRRIAGFRNAIHFSFKGEGTYDTRYGVHHSRVDHGAAALATNKVPADVTMMAALTLLLLYGIITPSEALKGFANPGLMTIGALYVVSAALRDTGAIYWVAHRLLGSPKTVLASQTRMIVPTSLLSAFLNNTTVVAMMIPAVQDVRSG